MSDRGILIFAYDGSFEGFLSAVFDSFSMKAVPADIVIFDDMEPSLLKIHYVETNPEHAKRVLNGIEQKLGYSVLNMVKKSFLFDGEVKEAAILRFIRKAFSEGMSAGSKIGDEDVNRVYRMCVAVNNEAEHRRHIQMLHLRWRVKILRRGQQRSGALAPVRPFFRFKRSPCCRYSSEAFCSSADKRFFLRKNKKRAFHDFRF